MAFGQIFAAAVGTTTPTTKKTAASPEGTTDSGNALGNGDLWPSAKILCTLVYQREAMPQAMVKMGLRPKY